jgi:hypothetical protein
MIQIILTPDSELITFPIPEKYIGTELEIIIFPIKDVSRHLFIDSKKMINY